jgi:hypothetical protein
MRGSGTKRILSSKNRCLIKGPENKMKCEICHGEVIPTCVV